MQNLPIDVLENVFLFVPVGETIKKDTSKEEIERLFLEKIVDFKNNGIDPYKYIWTIIKKDKYQAAIVRIDICCNEYITEIVTVDCSTLEVNTWNIETPISKRDLLDMPKDIQPPIHGLPELVKYYYGNPNVNGGSHIISHQGDKTIIEGYQIGDKRYIDWEDFLDFLEHGTSNNLNINRIHFLDYNIIETICGYDDTEYYYNMLNVFDALYAEGYWTYGGFKNYLDSGLRLPTDNQVEYSIDEPFGDSEYKTISISKDGKLTVDEDTSEKLVYGLTTLGAYY